MRLIPMPGVVLVEPIKDDSIIQSTSREVSYKAIITHLPDTPCAGLEIGDVIFYDDYSWRTHEYDGKEIMAVDILGDAGGVWIKAKLEENENPKRSTVSEEGLSTSVQTNSAI